MGIIDKLKEFSNSMNGPREDLPDDMTRDMFLRSLRRQRRVQMEEQEKERLKKQIAGFNRENTRKHLFGFKNKVAPKQGMLGSKPIKFKKKQSFFKKAKL